MVNFIEYLKGPELVVAVQQYFGIRYKNQNNTSKVSAVSTSNGYESGIFLASETICNNVHRRTLSDESNCSKVSTVESDSSSSVSEDGNDDCVISNRFWYYLFITGTALGDEIFYATFIPFWFWNIDGAVGRRVVFVWSLVMYVGEFIFN